MVVFDVDDGGGGNFLGFSLHCLVVVVHFCLTGKKSGKAIAVATPVDFPTNWVEIFFY